MFCRRELALFTLTIFLIFGLGACRAKQSMPRVEWLALAPFENLSSDSKLNWAGRAVASALAYDLAPSSDLHAQTVDSISGAFTAKASRMLEGYFFERNGRVVLVATLEDLAKTRTVSSFELSGQASYGVLPLLNDLAKRLSPTARSFGTAKEEAFRVYEQALAAGDVPSVLRGLESAAVADPHFTAAYLVRARLLAAEGQRVEALKLLQAARAANPDAIDTAEMDFLAASIAGDAAGRAKALRNLARLTPTDAARRRELASLLLSERRFRDAVASFEGAAKLDPDEPELWNQLGYAYALAGDGSGAHRALERYAEMLGSADSNALDSSGEVSFFLGDFAGAEKYFLDAAGKNPARRGEELMKAAEARLMSGDLGGADGIFQKYLELAQPAQRKMVVFEQAQWEFLTGRRKSGTARLEQTIPTLEGDQQALAMCQLLLWKLETGTAKDAAEITGKAEGLARSPRVRGVSAICRVLAAPPAGNSGSRVADAYALLFARKYAEAIAPLEEMYRESNPTADGQIRTMLAWAYVATGKMAEARKLVEIYPLPLSSGDPVFASLIFPRFLLLKAMVLDSEGKIAEAKRSRELFQKYAGDVPDIWGSGSGG